MYSGIDKEKEEDAIKQELKDKFHEDFVSDSLKWKDKMRTFNEMLEDYSSHFSIKTSPYRYNEFCRVCYYAISDVINELINFFAIYPTENEAFALKDALITSGEYSEEKYLGALNDKKSQKFLSLQASLSEEMERKMLKFLIENKASGRYEEFVFYIGSKKKGE